MNHMCGYWLCVQTSDAYIQQRGGPISYTSDHKVRRVTARFGRSVGKMLSPRTKRCLQLTESSPCISCSPPVKLQRHHIILNESKEPTYQPTESHHIPVATLHSAVPPDPSHYRASRSTG